MWYNGLSGLVLFLYGGVPSLIPPSVSSVKIIWSVSPFKDPFLINLTDVPEGDMRLRFKYSYAWVVDIENVILTSISVIVPESVIFNWLTDTIFPPTVKFEPLYFFWAHKPVAVNKMKNVVNNLFIIY